MSVARTLFAIPGDLATLSGGYGYDRRVLDELPAQGIDARYCRLPGGFPFPDAQEIADSLRLLREADAGRVLLVDGLAFGALPADGLAELRRPTVALVHHPLGLESGLDAAARARLIAAERAALVHADHVIVTSATTRDTLVAGFAVASERITVAEPGADPAPRAKGSGEAAPVIVAVGALVARKGYDILIAALSRLARLDWRLRIIGSLDRAPSVAAALRSQIAAAGLAPRIELTGDFPAEKVGQACDAADLFVLSSHYEGYGMVLAEAMARGLPIVTTTGGAAARTVPDAAAIKVRPGDVEALADGLALALRDPGLRARLADAAWAAGQVLPRWNETAAIVARALRETEKRT